ncbi:MAG: zinc ribbon domain-containing protein [Nitrososphaerota archaeon]|nr:zinc ribbon domain-containing protein [Nitrososphaerota archaeon]
MASELREIPMWAVYGFVGGFLIALVGGLFSIWGTIVGAVIIILVGFIGYSSQGRTGVGATMLPALHRELAKTHCGQCGAAMRSNMMFCPSCGARQTAV